MSWMIVLMLQVLVVAVVETINVVLMRRAVKSTRVATGSGSEYMLGGWAKWIDLGVPVVTLTSLFVVNIMTNSFVAGAIVVVLYLVVRAGTIKQNLRSANATLVLRMSEVLSKPEIENARFAFFFSGPHMLDPYHVTMWLEPLISLNIPFLIVVQQRKHLAKIPVSDHYSTVCIENIPGNVPILNDSIKAVFYANNANRNFAMMKLYSDKKHIQLLHGDSDKPPSYHPTAKAYDYLFVAGQMGVDRYASNNVHIRPEAFKIVGRPQLNYIPAERKETATLVYMPTWAGDFEDMNFSSFSMAPQIIENLLKVEGIDEIIFKPHPVSYKDPNWNKVRADFEALATKSSIPVRWAAHNESPFDLYAKADVLISDISSTIIDYLYSGKPYLVTNPQGFSKKELEKYPSVAGGYLCDSDAKNVTALVRLALGDDPMVAKRNEVKHYAFGDLERPRGEAFREACLEVLD